MDNAKEIKAANRRALPKFLLLVALACAVGFVFGFSAVKLGFDSVTDALGSAGLFFSLRVAPWLLVLLAAALPCVCLPMCSDAAKRIKSWDGEDEVTSDEVEQKLSKVLYFTTGAMILAYFLLSAAYSVGMSNLKTYNALGTFGMSVGAFVVLLAEMTLLQQKCVDSAKTMNPEKTASTYDLKFQQKWLESCDEAEKLMIGQCALKAFTATNKICSALAGGLAISALVFGTGMLPSLAVCSVWMVNELVYIRETMKTGVRKNEE